MLTIWVTYSKIHKQIIDFVKTSQTWHSSALFFQVTLYSATVTFATGQRKLLFSDSYIEYTSSVLTSNHPKRIGKHHEPPELYIRYNLTTYGVLIGSVSLIFIIHIRYIFGYISWNIGLSKTMIHEYFDNFPAWYESTYQPIIFHWDWYDYFRRLSNRHRRTTPGDGGVIPTTIHSCVRWKVNESI